VFLCVRVPDGVEKRDVVLAVFVSELDGIKECCFVDCGAIVFEFFRPVFCVSFAVVAM